MIQIDSIFKTYHFRFREQKELKSKLADLKKNMDNEHADEEIKRKYFLTMVKLFIYEAIDELNSIDMEKPILEHMANMKKDEKSILKRPPQPLKPIIITRDEIQKAVFGAGYPSLPTMTVCIQNLILNSAVFKFRLF